MARYKLRIVRTFFFISNSDSLFFLLRIACLYLATLTFFMQFMFISQSHNCEIETQLREKESQFTFFIIIIIPMRKCACII